MRTWLAVVTFTLAGCNGGATPEPNAAPARVHPSADSAAAAAATPAQLIAHDVETIDGSTQSLADYRGSALLIVNTASECGYTPQYAALQQLHERYAARGLRVLAFPSNDFGAQEPGSNAEIAAFVREEFGVRFPVFAKVKTKGEGQAPLYATLTQEVDPKFRGDVKWNFTKFLVDPQGRVVGRFESDVEPLDPQLVEAIEAVLPRSSKQAGG